MVQLGVGLATGALVAAADGFHYSEDVLTLAMAWHAQADWVSQLNTAKESIGVWTWDR